MKSAVPENSLQRRLPQQQVRGSLGLRASPVVCHAGANFHILPLTNVPQAAPPNLDT